MYRLQVTKFEDSPDYDKQVEELNRTRYCYDKTESLYPPKQIEQGHLDVIITDEEYAVIKKEVIKVS